MSRGRYLGWDVYKRNMSIPSSLPLSSPLPFPGASLGKITIQAEEVQDSKYSITMQLSATKVDKKDFFGKVCKHDKMSS